MAMRWQIEVRRSPFRVQGFPDFKGSSIVFTFCLASFLEAETRGEL